MAKNKKKNNNKNKRNKNATGPAASQLVQANTQDSSLLFQKLSQELRDLIYSHLFDATRLSHGDRPTGRIGSVCIKPAPNSLSLLRTCRRAKVEIGDTWLGQVLFSFENAESMLNKLAPLPIETLSKIRHLRVRGDTLMLSWPDDDVHYRLVSAFKLLPGLQLNTLTVLGDFHDSVSYDTLNGLIAESDGWKELHFLSHNSALLGYAQPTDLWNQSPDLQTRYLRSPQPATWRNVLERRDGPSSKPTVTIYRSTENQQAGAVMKESTRVRFEQKPEENIDEASEARFGVKEDAGLMAEGERDKELLIVIRRGEGVNYEETKNSPFIRSDIRKDLPGMSWREIKKKHVDFPSEFEDEDDFFSDEEEDPPMVVDSYDDVGDYVWTPLHFNPDA